MPERVTPESFESARQTELDRGGPQRVGTTPRVEGPKELPPLRGWEKSLAEWNPTAYALGRAFMEDISPFLAMPYTIPLIYAKYAFPSNRDEFEAMDQTDQTRTLLYDALFTAVLAREKELVAGVGMAYRGLVKKPGKAVATKLGQAFGVEAKAPKVVPHEDAVKKLGGMLSGDRIKKFSYADEVKRKLVNKGFAKDEAEAVTSVLHGEGEGALMNVTLERKFLGKEMTKPFKAETQWETGRLYPKLNLNPKMAKEFSETAIRQKFYAKQFEEALVKDVYKGTSIPGTVDKVFQTHVKRLYPEAAEKGLGFGEVTPTQMSNVLLDMLENKSISWQAAHPTLLATFHPSRIVFGIGQKVLGTLDSVYYPMKGYLAGMNRDYFSHSLLWAKMLEQVGAHTSVTIKATGEFVAKRAKWMTPKVMDEANTAIRLMDDLSSQAAKVGKAEAEVLQAEILKVGKDMSPHANLLAERWRTFSDTIYGEHVQKQIPRLLNKAGLTRAGQANLNKMMSGVEGVNYKVDRLFSTLASKNSTEKITGVKEILKTVQANIELWAEAQAKGLGQASFTAASEKELATALKSLTKDLSWKKGGFMRYLDNYAARVSQNETAMIQAWQGAMKGQQKAAHTQVRKLEVMRGKPVTFGEMVQARTMGHAKEHYLYDGMADVMKWTETLPPAWQEYTEAYLTGILGRATVSDYKAAIFLTKTYGAAVRALGGEGIYNEQRVMRLAQTMNNLTYVGGLGFKPFSAVRNLFQPLLNVPADLGGLKDLGHLANGWKWAMKAENRKYIQSIGAITEYVPEIHLRPSMLRQGKVVFGKELPTLEGTRDAGLWMFKGADRFNRYSTGGAAVLKWDKYATRYAHPNAANRKAFSQKMGLHKRREWKRAEIEDLIHRGKMSEAKAVFVNDVIADTQFLYGAADAPVVLRKFGGVGRTAAVFQSWWMNYGSLIHKWLTTGQSPGVKAERMITAMVSQSMAYSLMEPMWGAATAGRATFLGPFPAGLSEFSLPPAWSPVYHAAAAVRHTGDADLTSRHAKATLDSAMILVPGGLQIKTFYKGVKEEGFKGFGKAFLRLK